MKVRAVLYSVLVFFAGALTSSTFEWMAPTTTIEVTNTSGKVIKNLDIDYRGMGEHKGRIAQDMAPGTTLTFKWATDSEASYGLRATFDDGAVLAGGAGYTQRGNTVKESIEAKRVVSSLPIDFTFGLLHSAPRDTTSLQRE